MRSTTSIAVAMLTTFALTFAACSFSNAQCRGGSRGGTPGSGGPSGNVNNMAYGPLAQQQYQRMLAQQQYRNAMLAQQRGQRRQLARQEPTALEATPTFGSEELRRVYASGSSRRSPPPSDRDERIRQRNAQRTYAYAVRAASAGELATAERQFRKVVAIVGESDELGRLASRSLEDLNQQGFENPAVADHETVLVSLTSNGG